MRNSSYGRSCPRSCDGAKGSLWPSGNLLSGGWAATPTSSQAGGPSRDLAVHAATAASFNLAYVDRGAPIQIRKIRSVGHEAASLDIVPGLEDSRQPMLCREIREASSLKLEYGCWPHDQSTRARLGHIREDPVEVLPCPRLKNLKLHPERPR